MIIAFIGNYGPPNSTENDLAATLTQLGHTVKKVQEERLDLWQALIEHISEVDMVLWTRTGGLAAQIPHAVQRGMQLAARRAQVPTVGYHLDRWWGLSRESDVLTEPWFQCEYVFTPDGAHDADWAFADVNHHYMPPALALRKCKPGVVREEYQFDIVFVGSHFGGYHEEWQHRPQLIDHLRTTYGDRVGLFPLRPSDPRIDNDERADLFASAKVVVGDSCLVPLADGTPMHHYCSDRVFETIGQGGYLIHPLVDGILGPLQGLDLLIDGVHATGWPLWDWAALDAKIEAGLALTQTQQRNFRKVGFQYVKANHTYNNRMKAMLDVVFPPAS